MSILVTWRNAGVVGGAAVAGGSAPAILAVALAALALAVLLTRAKETVVAVARKVVALAELARDVLQKHTEVRSP